MNDRDSARRLHESTKHGTPPAHPEALVSYQRLDPSNAPRPFKDYVGMDSLGLPRELVTSSVPATEALGGGTGERSPMDLALLSTLLFLSAGVTRVLDHLGRRLYFRTAMSAGNLHPVEVYVVAGEGGVEGLRAGMYHFSPLEFAVTPLRDGDHRGWVDVDSPLAVILTGIPWRTTWKYGERGWRHLYWDAGTMLANFLAVADAHGQDHRTLLGFDDEKVGDLLGIDGVSEMPLAIVTLGGQHQTPPRIHPDPLTLDVGPLAPNPIRLPMLQQAQAGSTLASDDVGSWRQAGPGVAREARAEVASPDGYDDAIEDVILRRGSTRHMVRGQVPFGHLEWPMAASTRTVGTDLTPEGSLLEHYVNVHAVEGMEGGAYHYGDEGWELLRATDTVREDSSSLCLGQPLGGESAYAVFHCADLEPILSALGSRGYRAAQLESGVVSGRLALCAFALGLGATGLTFFDDAVTQYFETSDQPMLVTSVGVPAKAPAPAGTPGNPVALRV